MASSFFPTIFQHLLKGDVDLDTAEVKIMLLTSAYTFDVNDNDVADLTGEVSSSAPGYERKTITVTLSQDLASAGTEGCFINFDLTGGATWPGATFTCRSAVMYINAGGVDADSKLLYFFDFLNDQTVSTGTFSLTNANPQPKLRRYNGS